MEVIGCTPNFQRTNETMNTQRTCKISLETIFWQTAYTSSPSPLPHPSHPAHCPSPYCTLTSPTPRLLLLLLCRSPGPQAVFHVLSR